VLHSPSYREKYKEFLKIDFPRVPYPKNSKTFYELVELGGQLRELHLLESEQVENYITRYPIDGNNVVEKITAKPRHCDEGSNLTNPTSLRSMQQSNPSSETQNETASADQSASIAVTCDVYINDNQHFANVPLQAWEIYIGGYQPAQKWLKDRKGRTLTYDDIFHYQKIIVALYETSKIMRRIDRIEIE
jgi:predicted helicase